MLGEREDWAFWRNIYYISFSRKINKYYMLYALLKYITTMREGTFLSNRLSSRKFENILYRRLPIKEILASLFSLINEVYLVFRFANFYKAS